MTATKPVRSLWQNVWTIAGAALAILSALFFISFQVIEFLEPSNNPYTGLWSFLVLPFFLVVGLVLIPLGWLIEKRSRLRKFPGIRHWPPLPRVDLNEPAHRRGVLVFALGTLLVVPLVGISTYGGYHYTDSTQFCGEVCHSVMHPEFGSYLGSPHARVACVDCHIGTGATWYVKSKLSGVRQVFATALDTFPRPIPTPVKDLRPARETCEQCHWPAKFYGSQLRPLTHFAADESNSKREVRMVVKTGGGDASMWPASGIHWHMALSQRIEYIATDEGRQTIPWVRATDSSGRVAVYRSDGKSGKEPPPPGELRLMDCVDCHNRPTHIIYAPDRAVNRSMEAGRMDPSLPYLKKVALEALTEPYETEQEAGRRIESYIRGFYEKYDRNVYESRRSSINQAVQEVQSIYRRNFFPRMKVDWRVYQDNIGHMNFDGCFRCHDRGHVSDDGRSIRTECSVCHEFQVPLHIPGRENVFVQGEFDHLLPLQGRHAEIKCSSCHTGGRAPARTCDGCHTEQVRFAQGEIPSLDGVDKAESTHAGADCEACHDLSKPTAIASIGQRCSQCHEEGYGEMLEIWKQEVAEGKSSALAALARLESSPVKSSQGARDLSSRLKRALDQIDRSGALHNPGLADSIYSKIVEAAGSASGQTN